MRDVTIITFISPFGEIFFFFSRCSPAMATVCISANCGKEAGLHCPTCIKLGIKGSFFCGQECFKSNWKDHKKVHELVGEYTITLPEALSNVPFIAEGESKKGGYNPFPNYSYTGKLRPFPLSDKRTVPLTIPRPDYADHPKGRSLSEEAMRGNTTIKILDDEEVNTSAIVKYTVD